MLPASPYTAYLDCHAFITHTHALPHSKYTTANGTLNAPMIVGHDFTFSKSSSCVSYHFRTLDNEGRIQFHYNFELLGIRDLDVSFIKSKIPINETKRICFKIAFDRVLVSIFIYLHCTHTCHWKRKETQLFVPFETYKRSYLLRTEKDC